MLLTPGTISKAIQVGKFVGQSFMNVNTARGDLKMYHGDHLVEVPYTRAVRAGEQGFDPNVDVAKLPTVQKLLRFVVPEDAAKALGIFLNETVEDRLERLAKEAIVAAQVEKEAADKAAADKAAADAEAAAKAASTPPVPPAK